MTFISEMKHFPKTVYTRQKYERYTMSERQMQLITVQRQRENILKTLHSRTCIFRKGYSEMATREMPEAEQSEIVVM